MKQFACAILAFVAGLIVGTAGSDDSLLEEARRREASAYDRGYAEGALLLKTLAVQQGMARWEVNPHTGQRSEFVWMPPAVNKSLPFRKRESLADVRRDPPGIAFPVQQIRRLSP